MSKNKNKHTSWEEPSMQEPITQDLQTETKLEPEEAPTDFNIGMSFGEAEPESDTLYGGSMSFGDPYGTEEPQYTAQASFGSEEPEPEPEPAETEEYPSQANAPSAAQEESYEEPVGEEAAEEDEPAEEDTDEEEAEALEEHDEWQKIASEQGVSPNGTRKKSAGSQIMSSKEKKLAKKSKGKSSSTLKVLFAVLFALIVCMQGVGKISSAKELIGTTTLNQSTILNPATNPDANTPGTDPDAPIVDDVDLNNLRYIDTTKLEAMDVSDLAVWYMREFGNADKPKNEDAYREFQAWREVRAAADSSFGSALDAAIETVKADPSLYDEIDTTPKAVTRVIEKETTTKTPTTTQPTTPSTTTPTTTTPTTTPSKYTAINESMLNGYSAAQTANWVYTTFPPNSSNWNYQALGEYYSWLDDKGYDYASAVKGYLSVMGWSDAGA